MSSNPQRDRAAPASSQREGSVPVSRGQGPRDDRSATKRRALELFSGLPQRYDLLSSLLSFGQDPRWRRALVDAVDPAAGERVLDVATGTGLVAAELLSRSACTVVGLDQSPEMLAAARARFATAGVGERIDLVEGEAERLPFADASFDVLTFTYLLRYVDDPAATVRELTRVLRPGGRIASLEFGVPPGALARVGWRLYTTVGLPACGRVVSREWGTVGRFLGPSIAGFYELHPLPSLVGYWRAAGLVDVRVRRMSLGGGVVMSARSPDSGAGGRSRPRTDARDL
jgi:demethylmenaquinone methyltransferase / 2-methoxy-6-polyprenyl-1,4-benzoquinol methylase